MGSAFYVVLKIDLYLCHNFFYMAKFSSSTFVTKGNLDTTQTLLTITNPIGSGRNVKIKKCIAQLDCTSTLSTVMPVVSSGYSVNKPTGGTVLQKIPLNKSAAQSSTIEVLGATDGDSNALIPITATFDKNMWRQFLMRMSTGAGQVIADDGKMIPKNVLLQPGESFMIQVQANAGTINPASFFWLINIMWEEIVLP